MRTRLNKIEVVVIIVSGLFIAMNINAAGLSGRRHCKFITCQSNLRLMQDAFIENCKDNDDKFIDYSYSLWMNVINDYFGEDKKVLICPSTIYEAGMYDWGRWGSSEEPWVWTSGLPEPAAGSYGLNGWFYCDQVDWIIRPIEDYAYGNLSEAEMPEITPVFCDSLWVDGWPRYDDTQHDDIEPCHDLSGEDFSCYTWMDSPVRDHIQRFVIDRHFGVDNVSFVDGHVGSVRLERLWSLKWNKMFEIQDEDMTRKDGSPIYP